MNRNIQSSIDLHKVSLTQEWLRHSKTIRKKLISDLKTMFGKQQKKIMLNINSEL